MFQRSPKSTIAELEYAKQYRLTHLEQHKQRSKEWRQSHREELRLGAQQYRTELKSEILSRYWEGR